MLIIAKHRNGELGEIPLRFIHEQTKITNHSISNDFTPSIDFENRITSIRPNEEFALDKQITDFFDGDEEEMPF